LSIALGDMLKSAREAKALSMEQVAAITRLNTQFIEALEEGRWDKLPGQMYLRPFTKTYAEALGLDLKEVYRIIDGEEMEKTQVYSQPIGKPGHDYRLPLVIMTGVVIIALIYVSVVYQKGREPGSDKLEIVRANFDASKRDVMWNRAWQKPAEWKTLYPRSNRLRLEATDQVWASVIAGSDTLFAGFIDGGRGLTFFSDTGFILNIGRNDCISGYLDGEQIPSIGVSTRGLYNFHLDSKAKGE